MSWHNTNTGNQTTTEFSFIIQGILALCLDSGYNQNIKIVLLSPATRFFSVYNYFLKKANFSFSMTSMARCNVMYLITLSLFKWRNSGTLCRTMTKIFRVMYRASYGQYLKLRQTGKYKITVLWYLVVIHDKTSIGKAPLNEMRKYISSYSYTTPRNFIQSLIYTFKGIYIYALAWKMVPVNIVTDEKREHHQQRWEGRGATRVKAILSYLKLT